jgi:aspartate 1-decarboxylase
VAGFNLSDYFSLCIFSPTFALNMMIEVLKSKIHNVKVTQTELGYVGSVTIDEDLLDAANMIEGEKVLIVNHNNGERLETYTFKGDRGTWMICLNGAAARKAQRGDEVIIISFAILDFEEAKSFKPTLVFPGRNNRIE